MNGLRGGGEWSIANGQLSIVNGGNGRVKR